MHWPAGTDRNPVKDSADLAHGGSEKVLFTFFSISQSSAISLPLCACASARVCLCVCVCELVCKNGNAFSIK